MRTKLLLIAGLALLVRPAAGALFSCDEAGLDAAIAAGDVGDPGPHRLDCAPGDEVAFHSRRSIRAPFSLDAGGATLRCVEDSPQACSAAFTMVCSSRICAGVPAIELANLTVAAAPGGDGFRIGGVELTLRNALVLGERAPLSIGIDGGALHLVDSTVRGWAIGVWTGGATTIERSLLTGNSLALRVRPLSATELRDSTVAGNGPAAPPVAPASGVLNGGALAIANSTIAGNQGLAYSDLAAVFCPSPPRIQLISLGQATSGNALIEGECGIGPPSPPPPDCPGPPGALTSFGGNVESPGDSCSFGDPTDRVNVAVDALALGPLQDNAGPSDTRALQEGSVAIDAGVTCPPAAVDQRGIARPDGDAAGGGDCDAGAVEFADCDASGVDDGTEIAQGVLADLDANLVPDACERTRVAIDIGAGGGPKLVNPRSRGLVRVAILGSPSLDVAELDASSLRFGPGGAAPARGRGGRAADVNRDGFPDLVAHFRADESGIGFGDGEACLVGATLQGRPIEGCGAIRTPPPRHPRGSPQR